MFGPGFRKGVLSGESVEREVAAYLLDQGNFYSVPKTLCIELQVSSKNINKRGSLQLYVPHNDVAGNYGYSLFPVKEVHKIGILDLRILNCDRNENNILIQKSKSPSNFRLIPVDHGLSFPDCIEIYDYEIVWMSWPQSQVPFSKEELKHIENIDLEADLTILNSRLDIRSKCLKMFILANILLKIAAKKGFTLFEIGNMVYRNQEEEPSLLQKLLDKTKELFKLHKRFGRNIENLKLEFKEGSEEKIKGNFEEQLKNENMEAFDEKQISRKHKRSCSDSEIKNNNNTKDEKKKKEIHHDTPFFRLFAGLLIGELEKIKEQKNKKALLQKDHLKKQ